MENFKDYLVSIRPLKSLPILDPLPKVQQNLLFIISYESGERLSPIKTDMLNCFLIMRTASLTVFAFSCKESQTKHDAQF